jgi:hypothetical protein
VAVNGHYFSVVWKSKVNDFSEFESLAAKLRPNRICKQFASQNLYHRRQPLKSFLSFMKIE